MLNLSSGLNSELISKNRDSEETETLTSVRFHVIRVRGQEPWPGLVRNWRTFKVRKCCLIKIITAAVKSLFVGLMMFVCCQRSSGSEDQNKDLSSDDRKSRNMVKMLDPGFTKDEDVLEVMFMSEEKVLVFCSCCVILMSVLDHFDLFDVISEQTGGVKMIWDRDDRGC